MASQQSHAASWSSHLVKTESHRSNEPLVLWRLSGETGPDKRRLCHHTLPRLVCRQVEGTKILQPGAAILKNRFTEQNLEIENAIYIPSTRRGRLKRSQAVSEPKLRPKTRVRMLTSSLARFEDLEHLVLRYGPDLGQGHLPFACLLFPLLLYGVAQNLQSGPLKL
jgi:hypothetical protein